MSLYLGGSPSPFLQKGMDVLREVGERYKDSLVGAKAAVAVANSEAQDFFRVQERDQESVLTKTQSSDPKEAIALTEPALDLYRREKSKALNIGYHELVRSRTEWLAATGDTAGAKQEVARCRKDLAARGVNESVLNEIKAYEEAISNDGAKQPRKMRKR